MPQFSRGTLLQSSAVMAAPVFPARGEPGTNHNLLTKVWPVDRIAKVFIPRGRFRQFSLAGERGAWEALPADARTTLVQSAERQLKTPWEALPATLALEFKRDGNRSRNEAVIDRRRKKLQELVIAEGIECKGQFIDEIANGAEQAAHMPEGILCERRRLVFGSVILKEFIRRLLDRFPLLFLGFLFNDLAVAFL